METHKKPVVIDVSTRFANRHLQPVGITRVEKELIGASLARPADQFSYCRFESALGTYVPVPRSVAVDLASSNRTRTERFVPMPAAIDCTMENPLLTSRNAARDASAAWVNGRFDDGWLVFGACLYVHRTDIISFRFYLPEARDGVGQTKSISLIVNGCQVNLTLPRGKLSWSPPISVSANGAFIHILSDDIEPLTECDQRELVVVCADVHAPGRILTVSHDARTMFEGLARLVGEACVPHGAAVLVAGAPWNDDSLQWLARERERRALQVHMVMYDIVPLVIPEHCLAGMSDKFERMILEAARTSEGLYCISDNTRDDLRKFLESAGAQVPPLHRVRLGDTVDHSAAGIGPPRALRDLTPGKFILCVGTIESRKNHAMLFRVWRRMLDHEPQDMLPIVFVGQHGWGVDDLTQMIALNPRLSTNFIRIEHDVHDAQLRWLYENCRFTVYPSFYEGWGLPVVESLAYGKLCLASNTSSLPEAGQGLAELIDPDDFFGWYDRIRHFMTADDDLAAREAKIRERYKVADWETTFDEMLTLATNSGAQPSSAHGADRLARTGAEISRR